jgi:prepilin-type processing-associated H-X9-DG protein
MNCPKCGKENPDDAQLCQFCSCVLTQSTVSAEGVTIKTSGIGIASMVLGILSVFSCGITAIPAVILGIISLVQIEKSGGRLTGRAFGIVGIAIPVVVCCLIGVLMPALNKAHDLGRRAVCEANLRDLAFAWIMYADDNDGKIVNGQPNDPRTTGGPPPAKVHTEIPWALEIALNADGNPDPAVSKYNHEKTIKNGALWPYVKNVKVYRCPGGKANHLRTYSIVCSLNGDKSPVESLSNNSLLCVKNRSYVRRPHERIVFVDEGWVNNSSFRVGYINPGQWIDPPPVRHSGGMTFVFADGHSGYWKWKGNGTVKTGKKRMPDYTPVSAEDQSDLRDMRIAVWGKIP